MIKICFKLCTRIASDRRSYNNQAAVQCVEGNKNI